MKKLFANFIVMFFGIVSLFGISSTTSTTLMQQESRFQNTSAQTPLYLTHANDLSSKSDMGSTNWHESHASHSSHVSHYSHYSGR